MGKGLIKAQVLRPSFHILLDVLNSSDPSSRKRVCLKQPLFREVCTPVVTDLQNVKVFRSAALSRDIILSVRHQHGPLSSAQLGLKDGLPIRVSSTATRRPLSLFATRRYGQWQQWSQN
jgi:hypothetical protein